MPDYLIPAPKELRKGEGIFKQEIVDMCSSNREFIDVLIDGALFESLCNEIRHALWIAQPLTYYGKERDTLRNEINNDTKKHLLKLRSKLLGWQENSIKLYETMMPINEAEELIATKTIGLVNQIDGAIAKL